MSSHERFASSLSAFTNAFARSTALHPPQQVHPQRQLHPRQQQLQEQLPIAMPRTNETIQLFSSTLQSLISDAVALQQLTSLALLSGINPLLSSSSSSSSPRSVWENNHPPLHAASSSSNEAKQKRRHWLNQLRELDAIVTALEDKVRILGDICREEHRALEDLAQLRNDVEQQQTILENMLQATRSLTLIEVDSNDVEEPTEQRQHQQQQEQEASPQSSSPQHHPRQQQPQEEEDLVVNDNQAHRTNVASTTASSTSRFSFLDDNHNDTKEHKRKQFSGDRRRDSIDLRPTPLRHLAPQPPPTTPTTPAYHLSLARVTSSEWESVSRNIRGRIPLAVVNEALMDIETVLRRKFARRHPTRMEWAADFSDPTIHGGSSNSSSNDVYHQANNSQNSTNLPWVTEEELRQSCAFFRSGESTARSILWMLRTLQRLKQLPARNAQVTYLCLTTTAITTTTSNPDDLVVM